MSRGRNAHNFGLDLERFGEVTEEQATTIFQKIILELDKRVVLSTPVDTGRARGNWFPSIGAPSTQRMDDAEDESGSQAISAIASIAGSARLGDVAWLTNNLPYILPLENGHSDQAPLGMIEMNLNAIAAEYGGTIER